MIARRLFLGGVLALPVAARAQQFAGSYSPLATPIGDGIWMVRGADAAIGFDNGGAIANSVIMASDAGAIVVDTGPSLAFGKALNALARSVTGKPVLRAYVTHLHPDHSFGNGAFAAGSVHALPGTSAEIARDGSGFSDAMYRALAGWMTGTDVIVPAGDASDGEIEIGGRKLRLIALSGHSGADLAILDHASGTLIAGDLVFFNRAPATPHADLPQWQVALSALEAVPHRQLAPGHGPLDTGNQAIAQTRDWLTWLESSMRRAVANGLDMTEAGAIAIPERFSGMAAARYELHRSISHFYPRYEAELLPRIDR